MANNPKTIHRRTSGLSPEFALLGFLDQSPAHGYELHQKLIDQLGEIWHCSQSQTYNILTRLEAQGFIEGTPQPQEKRPDKRELCLTESGHERFETWLDVLSPCSVRAIRIEFMTRLYFLHARNPQAAFAMIDSQIEALYAHLERLKSHLIDLPEAQTFNRLGMSLRVSQLETLATWLESCKSLIPLQSQR
ncbi:MAG: helix-turn-helix transcriptional regulator [Anaerolineales bacterium]|jgi:DNA-binding PadR family transcriptional regulator|nr:helix-turn-helix transcriptional regulator [Anaerolineales bacterium]